MEFEAVHKVLNISLSICMLLTPPNLPKAEELSPLGGLKVMITFILQIVLFYNVLLDNLSFHDNNFKI